MNYKITELSRKLSNIIRFGIIHETDYQSKKVRVKSGDLITNWLDFATLRAGNVKVWNPPEKDEQVMILSPDGDLSQGVVLPSLFRDMFPALSNKGTDTIVEFADGTEIKYDSEAHKLTAALTAGSAEITAPDGVTVIGNLSVNGTITSTGDQLAGAISQQTHVHGGVQPGSSNTATPTA